jgi:hypothetical protein
VSDRFSGGSSGRTVFILAEVLVLVKPVKGSPESRLTDLPVKLPVISEDGSSPYEVTPLSSTKRTNLSTLMMNTYRVLNSDVELFDERTGGKRE